MIEAVIFDFDGVVADTMRDNYISWKEAFSLYNLEIDAEEYYKLEGMGRFQIADYFINEYNLNPYIRDEVVDLKEKNYKNKNHFKIYDYVEEIFSFLIEKNIPIGIVTGASKVRINEHLNNNLKNKLSILITADDVINTKPHPEPYIKAVLFLNKKPEKCLVIENAILGIESAKSAGCTCFALETTLDKVQLKNADKIFSSHFELLIQLKSLFKH